VVASLNIVGVTLIAASIVMPPVTARLLTDSFGKMLVLSTLIGMSGGVFGMFFSFEWDIASGAAIVLFLTALFLAVFTTTSLRTLLRGRAPAPARSLAPGVGPVRARADEHVFE
jgi:manganese/iron transport system permease protein/iron/zinc/copper transport system permease protein